MIILHQAIPLEKEPQRIARLTPVSDVLERIDALVRPVTPRAAPRHLAIGRTLAEDVVAQAGLPAVARALRDGFAVRAEATTDASAYAPAPLSAPHRVDVGDLLPAGTDAIAPVDAIAIRDNRCEALTPITPGEGVLEPEGDVRRGAILRRAGERLRGVDDAVLAIAGIDSVVVREPRIRVTSGRAGGDAVLDAACALIARAIVAAGGAVSEASGPGLQAADFATVLGDASPDAIIAIGGTGSGSTDRAVRTLRRLGRVEAHGFALAPGETAALGFVGSRSVLLLPGRVDAALAVWLTVGRHLLARLAGGSEDTPTTNASLVRKVASPLGLSEVVPVRVHDGVAEPLASGYWPLGIIAQADGWILVPPESEGYPAGAEVVVRSWP
jgi:molybdopterin molybdotransferase